MPRTPTDAYDRNVGLKVCHKRCDQCLFSSARIVSEERKHDIIKESLRTGRYFICHKASKRKEAAVCRGFFDEADNEACRMAARLKLVVYVDVESGKLTSPSSRVTKTSGT